MPASRNVQNEHAGESACRVTGPIKSCVFLTTPTSGSGSLWRIITALTEKHAKPTKIAEIYANSGRLNELADWRPEPVNNVYMYNTPHVVNHSFAESGIRLIVNFRDPRDLCCNQYHWALQHPMPGRTEQDISAYREAVKSGGIDRFVLNVDNNVHFRAFRAIESRLRTDQSDVLIVSYSELCLDFDNLLERMAGFLGVSPADLPRQRLERERTVNLGSNPAWIGQMWTGTDIAPGRYRHELRPETIRQLDDKYRENLAFLRSLERPKFRQFLTTAREAEGMEQVLIGKAGQLFLVNDSNDVIGQIAGRRPLSRAQLYRTALAHHARRVFGQTAAGFRYEHAIIPNKEVVLRGDLPEQVHFEGDGPRPVRQFLDSPAVSIWRPFYQPEVLEAPPGQPYFSTTDTHWNHAGAFRYFRAFLQASLPLVAPAMDAVPLRRFAARQQGDLGLKLEMPPEDIEILSPRRKSAKLLFENGLTGEGCIRWYENQSTSSNGRLFVLHDSCTLWLLEIIPELFQEAVFFHGTVFDFDFIERFKPSVVLCLQLERFFARVPDTGGSMFRLVEEQERGKKAVRRFGEFWNNRYL